MCTVLACVGVCACMRACVCMYMCVCVCMGRGLCVNVLPCSCVRIVWKVTYLSCVTRLHCSTPSITGQHWAESFTKEQALSESFVSIHT